MCTATRYQCAGYHHTTTRMIREVSFDPPYFHKLESAATEAPNPDIPISRSLPQRPDPAAARGVVGVGVVVVVVVVVFSH